MEGYFRNRERMSHKSLRMEHPGEEYVRYCFIIWLRAFSTPTSGQRDSQVSSFQHGIQRSTRNPVRRGVWSLWPTQVPTVLRPGSAKCASVGELVEATRAFSQLSPSKEKRPPQSTSAGLAKRDPDFDASRTEVVGHNAGRPPSFTLTNGTWMNQEVIIQAVRGVD
jgi:hypothetical protein